MQVYIHLPVGRSRLTPLQGEARGDFSPVYNGYSILSYIISDGHRDECLLCHTSIFLTGAFENDVLIYSWFEKEDLNLDLHFQWLC